MTIVMIIVVVIIIIIVIVIEIDSGSRMVKDSSLGVEW